MPWLVPSEEESTSLVVTSSQDRWDPTHGASVGGIFSLSHMWPDNWDLAWMSWQYTSLYFLPRPHLEEHCKDSY